MSYAWLVLAGLLLPQQPPPIDTGLVRSIELESRPGTWVQHFRLDREGARADELPLALLSYVAGPDPTGGVHAELELDYLAQGVRVIHVEQASPSLRRLVFRELHERSGRTLFLEGTPETGFQGYELGGREVVRHDQPERGEFPLLLIESARLGMSTPEHLAVLDPLAAAFEPLELASTSADGVRHFEARRADGSLRWRVSLRGERIEEWRSQERGPAARPISPEEFERLREQNELMVRAAREAAAQAKTEAVRRPRLRRL